MLTVEERERVAAAVVDVEAHTAGEIVVVVAAQASGYRSVPLIYALLAALATPWPLIWLIPMAVSRVYMLQLLVAMVALVVLSFPGRRYALVPRFLKRARAREAAAREFLARGLTRTRDRTGVLIYIAAAERYAEVLADTGIADRVDEAVWRQTVSELVEALRAGRPADGLITAVRRVGSVLAEHAPPSGDDVDELPNKVILR